MMRMRAYVRKSRTVLAVACTGLFLTAASLNAGGAAKLFTGGGYGPTPDSAIQAAIWDAEASASAEGLYTCTAAGEPMIFGPRPGPKGGLRFTAEATLSCTP